MIMSPQTNTEASAALQHIKFRGLRPHNLVGFYRSGGAGRAARGLLQKTPCLTDLVYPRD